MDIWSVGCIFAELLIHDAFFRGENPQHQLEVIVMKIGTCRGAGVCVRENERDFVYTVCMCIYVCMCLCVYVFIHVCISILALIEFPDHPCLLHIHKYHFPFYPFNFCKCNLFIYSLHFFKILMFTFVNFCRLSPT